MKRREQWYLIISILILSLSRNSKKMKIYLKPRKSTFFFFFIAFHLSPCFSEEPLREFKDCGVSYNCGELVNITYPFWGNKRQSFCGRKEFKLNCKKNQITTISINSLEYNVLKINQANNRMRIARSDLFENYCPDNEIQMASMDQHLFAYASNNQNISVWYNCSRENEIQIPEIYKFGCGGKWAQVGRANYAFEPWAAIWSLQMGECRMKIEVMITIEWLKEGIKERKSLVEKAVKWCFDVEYGNWYKEACDECNENGGKCGGNNTYPYYCICKNGVANSYDCKAASSSSSSSCP